MRIPNFVRAALVAVALTVPVSGCAFLDRVFQTDPIVSEQTLSEAELTLNLWVALADAYTNCGRPDAIPCPDGGARSDVDVVNTMAGYINAAHGAIVELRAGRGSLTAVWAAVKAVVAYGASHRMKPAGA